MRPVRLLPGGNYIPFAPGKNDLLQTLWDISKLEMEFPDVAQQQFMSVADATG